MKKVKGVRTINWKLQSGHINVKYSKEYLVNNVVITTYSITGVLDYQGNHFISYINV